MGRNYSFKLYFRNEDVEKALIALADRTGLQQKEINQVTLPNGKNLEIVLGRTMPLHTWGIKNKIIFRIATSMLSLSDDAIIKYLKPHRYVGDDEPEILRRGKIYYRVGAFDFSVRYGERYAEFNFMSFSSNFSLLMENSPSMHQSFLELLNAANGILGLLDMEQEEYLLLENTGCGVFIDSTPFYDSIDYPDVDWFLLNILAAKRYGELIWQRQGDPASFREKWIRPFPDSLFYSRSIFEWWEEEQRQFWTQMKRLIPEATDEVIELLLDDLNKRYNLIGTYFATFGKREQFAKPIGNAMIRYPYNANSYCFALARLGTSQAVEALESYLNHFIPINEQDPVWDELSIDWAIAALQYIDEQLGTQRAKNYITEDGAWDRWAGWKIKPARQELDKLLIVARQHFS